MNPVCTLAQVGRADSKFVGTKAAALGELLNAGFDVPDGFVLTVEAYSQVIQSLAPRLETRLTSEAINDPAEIETMAGEIRDWIEAKTWPADLRSALASALVSLSAGLAVTSFATRTSLPSDELATAFGSGVQRAFLGLVGPDGVERGVSKCWGALWTSRSIYYRERKKIPQTGVSLAVLIQPMVPADSAGVVLTQNPRSSDRTEIEIDSIWGLGLPLVQARVKPDRFLYDKHSRTIKERKIEEKTVRLAIGDDGGLEQQVVSSGEAEMSSLSDEQALALAELSAHIEEFFGEPQQIEWARYGSRFYILQSRPAAARQQ